MNNLNLFLTYKQDILNIFIDHYKKAIGQNIYVQFENILALTLKELNLVDCNIDQVDFLKDWFNKVHMQSFLHTFCSYSPFSEVIFHGNEQVQIINNREKENLENFMLSAEDFQLSLEVFSLKNNLSWNYSEPFISFNTEIASIKCRVTMVHFSTSANKKSKVFIRSSYDSPLNLLSFCSNAEIEHFIKDSINNKKNILIAGSTGSGKTTLLRSMLSHVNEHDHVIILEDTHEIIPLSLNQTSMLASENSDKKSLTDYCAYALRMLPDRLILGEMRAKEVVPFLLAMNTGHRGLMSTIHANSAIDAVPRIALLFSLYSENKDMSYELIIKLICRNIDYVVFVQDKKISEICKLVGSERDTPFFERIF